MAYPPGVRTRTVTFGAAISVETADVIEMRVNIKSSRSLVWTATGTPVINLGGDFRSKDGFEHSTQLPVTDQPGWGDGQGGVIDVSANRHSHSYIATVEYYHRDIRRASATIGPFVLPTDDLSPVDIDNVLPTGGAGQGPTVAIPDIWSEQIRQANEAVQAAMSVITDELPTAMTTEASRVDSPFGIEVKRQVDAAVPPKVISELASNTNLAQAAQQAAAQAAQAAMAANFSKYPSEFPALHTNLARSPRGKDATKWTCSGPHGITGSSANAESIGPYYRAAGITQASSVACAVQNSAGNNNRIPVTPGFKYAIRFRAFYNVASQASNSAIRTQFYDALGALVDQPMHSHGTRSRGIWNIYTAVVTAPANAATMIVSCFWSQNDLAPGDFFGMTQVQVAQTDSVDNLPEFFDGDSPGAIWITPQGASALGSPRASDIRALARTLEGSGSPEGIVEAPVGYEYVDTNATSGFARWTKVSGSGSTGWRPTAGTEAVMPYLPPSGLGAFDTNPFRLPGKNDPVTNLSVINGGNGNTQEPAPAEKNITGKAVRFTYGNVSTADSGAGRSMAVEQGKTYTAYLSVNPETEFQYGLRAVAYGNGLGNLATRGSSTSPVVIGQWYDLAVTFTATANGIVTVFCGRASSEQAEGKKYVVDNFRTDQNGPYFDGDTPGARWAGTPGLSSSELLVPRRQDVDHRARVVTRYSEGVGSPEGVIAASPGATYVDTENTNGVSRWVKISGNGKTGWLSFAGSSIPRLPDSGLPVLRNNYVRNSGFKESQLQWGVYGVPNTPVITRNIEEGYATVSCGSGVTADSFVFQTLPAHLVGKQLVASVDYRNTTNAPQQIVLRAGPSSTAHTIPPDGQWYRKRQVFTPGNNTVYVRPAMWSTGSTSVGGTIDIRRVLVEDIETAEIFGDVWFDQYAPGARDNSDGGAQLLLPRHQEMYESSRKAVRHYEGVGFPEGAVPASIGSRYIDTAATNGAVEWIKASGTGTTGWKVVYGDTGVLSIPLTGAIEGRVFLRRRNDLVQLTLSAGTVLTAPLSSGHIMFEHPAGFRPYGESYGLWATGTSGPAANLPGPSGIARLASVRSNNVALWSPDSSVSSGSFRVNLSPWLTQEAWPSSLPGS